MIKEPTVLLLGAGASVPYGYPLGSGLVRQISELIRPGGGLRGALGPTPNLDTFQTRLLESDTDSIDEFLESNPELYEVGKQCIVCALTYWGPNPGTLDSNADWYRYIWGRLKEGAPTSRQFRENKLSIVTYNYDSSLHRYLTRVLRAHYPDLQSWPEDQVRQFADQAVPVIHLHGSLGPKGDEITVSTNRPPLFSLDLIREMAARLKIVHDTEQQHEYSTARERIGLAHFIYILGFGFHPTNVRRLNLTEISNRQPPPWRGWGGTAFGLKAAEIDRAERSLAIGREVLQPVDALSYLRQFARLG